MRQAEEKAAAQAATMEKLQLFDSKTAMCIFWRLYDFSNVRGDQLRVCEVCDEGADRPHSDQTAGLAAGHRVWAGQSGHW